ncbi:imidazolonepropionase [Aliamphritea hakodatensis]|uniref:imidazolonepropionase n=1 Tax=Aliamphritea hakodatensis TaxID=2895352 RepID=UPI0022FD7B37|nr:imidazolonepropionase [Aliamphritea hakodatensis]
MSSQTCQHLWHGFHAVTMVDGCYNTIEDAAIAVDDGVISWVGRYADFAGEAAQKTDLEGGWVTPGMIDCHTHIVFGANRSREFELRLQGASYEEIARAGGGIANTVKSTRQASASELQQRAESLLQDLMADGVTTLEIKSGYGLDLENEAKMLRVARRLEEHWPVEILTTCLAAHAMPPEFSDGDAYIDYLCETLLPAIAEQQLADAVDGFCEKIAFSPAQIKRYLQTAAGLGLPLKLHAEQLSALGGSKMAAELGALSVDHLEYATAEDVAAMAENDTVAVILPGAFYVLKETRQPPVQLLRDHNVPMALASDSNPGSSPVRSLRLMMNMACTLFGFTPEEALAGVTCHAARALGLDKTHGTLTPGKQADFVCWNIESPAELSYWLGGRLNKARVKRGVRRDI